MLGRTSIKYSWSTHRTNIETRTYPLVLVIVDLVLMHGNTRYVTFVDVIQILTYFDNWRSFL